MRLIAPASINMSRRCAFLALLLCVPVCSRAEEAPPEALLDLDLGQLMKLTVVTASRHEQALDQAPALVTVLDGEDLRRHGYRSVAEALVRVPGFYTISDGVGEYVVVRGIDSGQRAYGRTLKVMIDGQPLGIRSNATQFLGPELIPMGLIERIEVVRGPASAIYGADAYLGVVNIITRQDVPDARLALGTGVRAGAAAPGVSGEVLSSAHQGPWSALATAAAAIDNRSGLSLPSSSPRFSAFADDRSHDDISRPSSAYARLRYTGEGQRHTLALHASELESNGEFLDFGTLVPGNRIGLVQQTVSWLSEWERNPEQHYQFRMAHAWGGPSERQRLDLGVPGSYPRDDFGYRDFELALEGQLQHSHHHLVAGVDGSWDAESPVVVSSVDASTGAVTPLSPAQNGQLFRNIGVYAQYQLLSPDRAWSPSLNWRHDDSNQYGGHNSYRVGLSRELRPDLHTKLLYGTSYKAPNANELYAFPLYSGDVLGNPGLVPETASSTDWQLIWNARKDLLLTFTAFHMDVRNLIALQPFGINQRWANVGKESGNGLESELRWQSGPQELRLTSSFTNMSVRQEQPLTPSVSVPTASAPRLSTTGEWRYRMEMAEFGIESLYASERRASNSNINVNLNQAYELSPYTIWRLHAMKQWHAHRLTLTLDNAFDRHYAEPGYGGVDLPAPRRTLWLGWAWQK